MLFRLLKRCTEPVLPYFIVHGLHMHSVGGLGVSEIVQRRSAENPGKKQKEILFSEKEKNYERSYSLEKGEK